MAGPNRLSLMRRRRIPSYEWPEEVTMNERRGISWRIVLLSFGIGIVTFGVLALLKAIYDSLRA